MTLVDGCPRIGVRWDPRWAPETLPDVARAVERLGYDELWLVEDCFSTGGLSMAGVALACTDSLTVGVGLLPAGVRNPAIIAMEIASLARLFPGRFVPAFGHGVGEWMRQIGSFSSNRLTVLEEVVSNVRQLLAGEDVSFTGEHVRLVDVSLEHPPAVPPQVLVGTTGPRGLAVAGRCADGVVLPEICGPAAVAWAKSIVREAGTPASRMVVYAYLSLDDESVVGLAEARPLLEQWTQSGVFPHLAALAGLGDDGSGTIDDDLLRTMAVAGSADDCVNAVRGFAAAGADSVVLLPRSPDHLQQVSRFAQEALPQLRPRR